MRPPVGMTYGDYVTPFGYSLHYKVDGIGSERILLVIGFASSMDYWGGLVDAIHEKFPGRYTTCMYDQRGVGGSTCVLTEKCSSTTVARDILGMLLHLNWVGKYIPLHLVSWSMGGFGSIELINVLQSEFGSTLNLASLTLCNTGHKFVLPAARSLVPGFSALGKGILSLLLGIHPRWIIPEILRVHYSPKFLAVTNMYAKLYAEYETRSPFNAPIYRSVVPVFQHFYAVLTHYVSKPRMKVIRECGLTMHAIIASEDLLIHPTASIQLARSLGCPFSYFPGGHMSHVENTCEVLELLVRVWDEGLSRNFQQFRTRGNAQMLRTLSMVNHPVGGDLLVTGSNIEWPEDIVSRLHALIATRMDRWGLRSLRNRLRQPGRLFIGPALILPILLIQLRKIVCFKQKTSKSIEVGLLVYVIVLILLVQEVTREEG